MITGPGTHSSIRKDHLGNKMGTVRPFGLSRERRYIPMDPQNLGHLSFPPSFASCAFACRRKSESEKQVGEIGS